MTVYFAANLVERQQFGLCQITVEGIDAALGRQSKAGCYLRRKSKNRANMVLCRTPVRSLGALPPLRSRSSRSRS